MMMVVNDPDVLVAQELLQKSFLAVSNNSGIDKSIGTKFHCFTSMIGWELEHSMYEKLEQPVDDVCLLSK